MRKSILLALAAVSLMSALLQTARAQVMDGRTPDTTIKTRLDNLSGTKFLIVLSYLPTEITSITCDEYTVVGVKSYSHNNDFTIPKGPAVGALIVTSAFNGYCKTPGSLVAHTDNGDFPGILDRGPGNWTASGKLTFLAPAR